MDWIASRQVLFLANSITSDDIRFSEVINWAEYL